MIITVDTGGLLQYLLLGEIPGGDDDRLLIGISRVAYLSKKDPGHVFIDAARWHDAAYQSGASIQQEWPRWKVDKHFLDMMIDIVHFDIYNFSAEKRDELETEALTLFRIVRKYGGAAYEGREF